MVLLRATLRRILSSRKNLGGSPFRGRLGLIIALAVLVSSAPVSGEGATWRSFDGVAQESVPEVRLLSADRSRVTLEVYVPGVLVEELNVAGETYHRLTLPDAQWTGEVGLPELPELRELIGIPGTAKVEVRVGEVETVELPDLLIYPAQPPETDPTSETGVEVKDEDFYQGSALYPSEAVVLDKPGVWRDVRVSKLFIRPFSYRPDTRTLIANTRMRVEISFAGHDPDCSFVYGERPILSDWAELYSKSVLNYESLGLPAWHGRNPGVDYLVITVDALRDSIMDLVDWHHRSGLETEVVNLSSVGTTANEVKDYILTRFNQDNITYVLLVGDIADLPIPYVYTQMDPNTPSDHWYACLIEPDDYYADILLSRISANTAAKAAHQVDKILEFETNPPQDDWTTKTILCAYEDAVYRNCKDQVASWSYGCDTAPAFEKCYAGLGGTRPQLIAAIENGTQLVNYRGHGINTMWQWSVGWNTGHVYALNNTDYYPLVFNVCCENGHLDAPIECLAEAWMNAPYAAAGNLAASRSSYTTDNSTFDRALYRAIYDECTYGIMEVVNQGKNAIIGPGTGDANALMYLWLGDPATEIWTAVPGELTVNHAGTAFLGMSDFAVEVYDGGSPLEDARVCVMTESGEVYEVGYTDADGEVVLSLAGATSVQDLNITVTSHNFVPYMTTIPLVTALGHFLICEDRVIDDDQAGDSYGNDDGDLDYGETAEFIVTLLNLGSATAPSPNATLSTTSGHVNIVDGYETFPPIPSGDSAACNDDFEFEILPTASDGDQAEFTLTVHSADSTWQTTFDYVINAPAVVCGTYRPDDWYVGDGDGYIDPGETLNLYLTLRNEGHADVYNLTADLSTTDPYVDVLQGTSNSSHIPGVRSDELDTPYQIQIDPSCPQGHIATLIVDITADYGYSTRISFSIFVGALEDDMESGAASWTHYIVTPGYNDEWHLDTVRNHTPGGNFSWYCAPMGGPTYSDNDHAALETQDITIPYGGYLTFWHYMDAHTGFGGGARDGGIVELSADGGVTWLQIEPNGGYPATIDSTTGCPFLDGTPCFGDSFTWRQETFDLEGHEGVARIRFVFGSDNFTSDEGWFIDDIKIERDLTEIEDITQPVAELPRQAMLSECSPNPFNPTTTINFALPVAAHVRLEVYDVTGRLVRTLVDERRNAGYHSATWQGKDDAGHEVSSGLYFYRMTTADFSQTRKGVLMK